VRILIVDPDWRFARKAAGHLESKAHLVVHLDSPEQVMLQCRQWEPELVIVAAEMTEDGLLEAIRSLPHGPAVLLTEHMDRYDRAWRAWQRGGDELLMKPVFYARELQEGITAAMENATRGRRDVAASA
jgi:DNA-binding response OmpR family regulator